MKMLFCHASFSIALKTMVIFTNAQDMCQIICKNIQALKCRINFQNISSRFVVIAIYSKPSKLTGIPNRTLYLFNGGAAYFSRGTSSKYNWFFIDLIKYLIIKEDVVSSKNIVSNNRVFSVNKPKKFIH